MFEGIDQYLSTSRLVVLDGCSHWVQHDAPAALNRELAAVLAEVDGKVR